MIQSDMTITILSGKHFALLISGGGRLVHAVVEIDKYGGHRHYFECRSNGEVELTTESISAAVRWYNEGGKA